MAGTAHSAYSVAQIFSLPETHQRLFDNKVFTWTDWRQHRIAAWRHRPEPIVFMRVALGFVWQLIMVMVVSILVGLYQTFLVPLGAPGLTSSISTAFSMITFALSLLLVFKTNSSYARWWEGRIIWGQVVNYGRNLPRSLLTYAPAPEAWSPAQRDIIKAALRWIAAAPHVLKGHLWEATSLKSEDEASHLLTSDERDYLRRHWASRPLGVAHVLSWLCCHRLLGQGGQEQVSIQDQITWFVNCAGGCERIQRTPIPSAYTRHTSRMLVIYVTLSPLLLWPATGWATPVVAPLIAFLLLGIENVGVMIEEPFRVLPLNAICKGIEAGVMDMAAAYQLSLEPSPPPTLPPANPLTFGGVSGAGSGLGPGALDGGNNPGSEKPSPTQVMLTMLGLNHHPELRVGLLGGKSGVGAGVRRAGTTAGTTAGMPASEGATAAGAGTVLGMGARKGTGAGYEVGLKVGVEVEAAPELGVKVGREVGHEAGLMMVPGQAGLGVGASLQGTGVATGTMETETGSGDGLVARQWAGDGCTVSLPAGGHVRQQGFGLGGEECGSGSSSDGLQGVGTSGGYGGGQGRSRGADGPGSVGRVNGIDGGGGAGASASGGGGSGVPLSPLQGPASLVAVDIAQPSAGTGRAQKPQLVLNPAFDVQ